MAEQGNSTCLSSIDHIDVWLKIQSGSAGAFQGASGASALLPRYILSSPESVDGAARGPSSLPYIMIIEDEMMRK